MFGFAVVASTKTKREKAKNKDVVIIEKWCRLSRAGSKV